MLRVSLYQMSLDEVDPDEAHLAPNSFERWLRDVLPTMVSAEDFAGFYAEEGGGSRCPLQLLGLELLKFRWDLSDRQLIEHCWRDLGFRYAVGLRKGEAPPGTATLTRFRAKLRKLKGDDFVMKLVLKLAVARGVVDDMALQGVDSTNTDCRGAIVDTFNLIAAGIRQVIRAVARGLSRDANELARQWELEDYMARSIKGQVSIDWSDPAARTTLLTKEICNADRLVEMVGKLEMTLPPEVAESVALLQRVARQDVKKRVDGTYEIARGTAPGRIISVSDPEARHGRKSSSKRINGFKVHVLGTLSSQFVTGIAMTDASVHDARPTVALVQQAEQYGLKPREVVGDGAYGTGANIRQVGAQDVTVLSKLGASSHNGSIPKRAFDIDLDGQRVTCPAGKSTATVSMVKDPAGSAERVQKFRFAKADCQSCALRNRCSKPTAAGRPRTITLSTHEPELQQLKAFNKSERAKPILRSRSAIERLLSHLVRMGMRHARFFGLHKVQYQAFMTAAAYNLQRLFTLIAGSAKAAAR